MTDLAVPTHPADRVAALRAAFLDTRRTFNTQRAYARDIDLWLDYCARSGTDPLNAWPANVQLWLAELMRQGESGSTRGRRLGAVSSWYGWLVRHQAAARNPATLEREERPVRAPRPTPALSDEQVGWLLAAADRADPRDRALVWLLLLTGVRVSEAVGADTADVGLDRGHPVLHVRGKGGKARVVALVPPVFERLDAYLTARPDAPGADLVPADSAPAGARRPLFATATGSRVQRTQVRRILAKLGRRAGLPDSLLDHFGPHATRATYITSALDAGVPVRDVQYSAGHASPVTTEGYDRSQLSPERSPAYVLARRFRPAEQHHQPSHEYVTRSEQ